MLGTAEGEEVAGVSICEDVVINVKDASYPHTKDAAAIASVLGVDIEKGLDEETAKKRLETDGEKNRTSEKDLLPASNYSTPASPTPCTT